MSHPTVYIVDDDPGMRKSLALWLGFRDLHTRQFDSAESFLEQASPEFRGCAILDYCLGGMDGLQLQAKLRQLGLKIPLIFLTAHGSAHIARNAMKDGAFDFLEKPVDSDQLAVLVQQAMQQDQARWETDEEVRQIQTRLGRLTGREKEVLAQVVNGAGNRDIAASMAISPRTVEVYKARIMDKLGVRGTAELVRLVVRVVH
jgi:FixJ family two-component response regulator